MHCTSTTIIAKNPTTPHLLAMETMPPPPPSLVANTLSKNLVPGNYSVTEANPHVTDDGDENDGDETVDNKILVTVGSGEKDDGNNFVDVAATPSPIAVTPAAPVPPVPSLAPVTVAPISKATPQLQTAPPTQLSTLPPTEYCEEVDNPSCSLCAAFHAPGKSKCILKMFLVSSSSLLHIGISFPSSNFFV
jgi:hypothetical protein